LKQRWLQIFADLDVNAHHQDDCKNSTSITSKHAPTLPPPSNRQSISNDNTQNHPWQHSSAKQQQQASNDALHSSITCLFNGQTYHTTTTMAAA
jgi:hypothetical protein